MSILNTPYLAKARFRSLFDVFPNTPRICYRIQKVNPRKISAPSEVHAFSNTFVAYRPGC